MLFKMFNYSQLILIIVFVYHLHWEVVLLFSTFTDICKCSYRQLPTFIIYFIHINELKTNSEIDLFSTATVYGIKLEYDDLLPA